MDDVKIGSRARMRVCVKKYGNGKMRYTSEVGSRRYRWVWFTTIRVPLPHENQVVYHGIEMHRISPRLAFELSISAQ
jgi:hypothetical protein